MKSKSTSNFDRNFIFNVCINQNEPFHNNERIEPAFNLKNKDKMASSRTLGKPISMSDLNLNKKDKKVVKKSFGLPQEQFIMKEVSAKKV